MSDRARRTATALKTSRTASRAPRSTSSVQYAFDALNRLTLTDPLDRLRPVRVLEGRVTTDAKNRLVYQVTSADPNQRVQPRAIRLDGTWALAPSHDLVLALHRSGHRGGSEALYLKGAVVGANAQTLVFALRQSEQDDLTTAQRLTLSGRWSADADNRLTFLVGKANGAEDRLTLQGGWEVGPNHELVYRYRKQSPDSRTRDEHVLAFDGAWDITGTDRLVYRLTGDARGALEFKAILQSPTLQGRTGRLVYQVGIGVSGGRSMAQRVVLFGKWKLNTDRSVSFEVPYANGRREAILFHGIWSLNARNEISVDLSNRRKQPLGFSVTFSRQCSQDARWFLRLRTEGRAAEALAGVQIRF